jgi:hypothetical protein
MRQAKKKTIILPRTKKNRVNGEEEEKKFLDKNLKNIINNLKKFCLLLHVVDIVNYQGYYKFESN